MRGGTDIAGPGTLWLDVDDLLRHIMHHSRPSGIQRVTFELCAALAASGHAAGQVGFVRRGADARELVTVRWDRLDAAFRTTANQAIAQADAADAADDEIASDTASSDLREAWAQQARALRLVGGITGASARRLGARIAGRLGRRRDVASIQQSAPETELLEGTPLAELARPGDSLVVLGSPWNQTDYARTVRWARDERRMRFALLMYDLVPLRRPEWCDRTLTSLFADWHESVLPLADQVFAISRATAGDVTAWMAEKGIDLANPIAPVPMGTDLRAGGAAPDPTLADNDRLPPPGSYVLFVSTIEIRKNHALLFRAWRRLLARLPAEQVPTLVFAGRVGWMVNDLMQQLDNSEWLGGKIRHVRDPTDAELAALYKGCLFTVFPSLFEGWGLPVSESLGFGAPCVVSNRTSLPEAGGTLARYFDPENLEDAVQTIASVLADPAGLAAWRAQVAAEFRHVPWSDSAAVITERLAALDPRPC